VGFVCCAKKFAGLCTCLVVLFVAGPAHPWEGAANLGQGLSWNSPEQEAAASTLWNTAPASYVPASYSAPLPPEYLVKMAYGRTFGTCTELDYATLEVSKRVKRYPAMTLCGPAIGEVQFAVLGSYVVYYEGALEKLRRLDFRDGFELAGIPKGRFTFPAGPMGMSTYVESGVGMSYVSETFRNSGSRWNWSLLGGVGFERCMPGNAVVALGVQWRHLSNGNMWGKGDELHNSNSGTDMIQGLATFVHQF
jgi:hypothetical protein